MRKSAILLIAVVSCLGASSTQADLTLDDGLTHNIDSAYPGNPISGHLFVNDGPGSTTTTVNLLTGGSVAEDLRAEDSSLVNVYSGSIGDDLRALNNSMVNVYGGSIGTDLLAYSSSVVNVHGGLIGDDLRAYTNSLVNLYGGSITDDLRAANSSVVNIYGHGFNYPYGPVTATSGTLTGTLSSGDSLSVAFDRDLGATINLTPVPGAFVLGSIGLGVAGWKLRRRRTL